MPVYRDLYRQDFKGDAAYVDIWLLALYFLLSLRNTQVGVNRANTLPASAVGVTPHLSARPANYVKCHCFYEQE